MANKLEKMLFGNVKNRIPVDVMTDSLPLLTSIASTKRVENLNMVNTVELMKEKMLEQEVARYSYVNTRDNVADLLTKYKTEMQDFKDIFVNGIYIKGKKEIDVTLHKCEHGNEIRIKGDIKQTKRS